MAEGILPENASVNLDNLYRQENYTDLGLGTIQCLRPVTAMGADDASRKPIFMGTAQIMTQHGPIPVQCEIPAENLKDACVAFPEAIQKGVEELVQQAREFERERQGGIVIPRAGKFELP